MFAVALFLCFVSPPPDSRDDGKEEKEDGDLLLLKIRCKNVGRVVVCRRLLERQVRKRICTY